MPGSPFRLESRRLRLREAVVGDIERIYEILRSNPEFLMLRDDIATEADYDLSSVTRYCEAAMLEPTRHLLVVVDTAADAAVGLVDFVDVSPADGRPWIGLVAIHHAAQRQGLGSEALTAVLEALGSAGHPVVHMAVMEANAPCLAFAESLGFAVYDMTEMATSPGTPQVLLMEAPLRSADPSVGEREE